MQHEAAVGAHRPPAQHDLRADLRVARLELHLREHIAQHHRRGLVEDDAQRPLVAVLTHQRHRVRKVTVGERRHGDQQVVGEARLGHDLSMAAAGGGLKERR
jgi:hypothetical protein